MLQIEKIVEKLVFHFYFFLKKEKLLQCKSYYIKIQIKCLN